MALSIIPKPVSIKYTEGIYKAELTAQTELPFVIKKEGNPLGAGQRNPEAYKLTILKEGITLQADSSAGIINGELVPCLTVIR